MAGLEEPEYRMYICPHTASNLCPTLTVNSQSCLLYTSWFQEIELDNDKLFQQAFFAREVLNTKV